MSPMNKVTEREVEKGFEAWWNWSDNNIMEISQEDFEHDYPDWARAIKNLVRTILEAVK